MTLRFGHAGRVGIRSLLAAAASFGADAQPADTVAKLKREGLVTCEPAVPYFCANLHVSCAGKTTVPTFHFSLRVTPTGGSIEASPDADVFVEQYASSQVEWSGDGQSVIVRPLQSSGYIQVFKDGKYIFRHYPQQQGIMSRGTCA